MPFKVTRRLGRAGAAKQCTAGQWEWDTKFGQDVWAVDYVIDGTFVAPADGLATAGQLPAMECSAWGAEQGQPRRTKA